MGKKKRGHPDVEELISRPWCYYCERDFEDLKLLISHQKAKHYKCDRCGKRLNTAGGLSVHMNQVHKENLTKVENAISSRQGLDIEIFGMEGVPEDVLQQHNQRVIQDYYQAQAERYAATGNPPPGQSGGQGPTKKIKIETPEEIKKRLADHRAKAAAQKLGGKNGAPVVVDGQSPATGISPFPPPQGGFPYPPPGMPGVASFPPSQAFPPAYPPGPSPPPGAPGAFNLPARPPGSNGPAAPASNLPPISPYGGASTVDELIANAAAQGRQGDDIDQLIRMAEAGIRPQQQQSTAAKADEPGTAAAGGDKKGKKDKEKNVRMVYGDNEVSPEEMLARMPRYAYVPEAEA